MRFRSLAALFVPLAVLVLSAGDAAAQRLPKDSQLRKAWEELDAEMKTEVVEYFQYQLSLVHSTKLENLRYALSLNQEDPGFFRVWEPTGYYDPEEHAPGMPIARKVLPESSSTLEKARLALLPTPKDNALIEAYAYDFGTGEIVRVGDPDDHDALFENVLRGYAPRTDLARAALMKVLDDGLVRVVLQAFSHTYTDLEGKVYTGITLYDAWRSGKDIFMPDVDVLGIVHDVLDDWETWVSPVPDRQHAKLYRRVGELFGPARYHKELRVTLADLYLSARPAHVGTYLAAYHGLHALWTKAENDPAKMVGLIPADPNRIPGFLKAVQQVGKKDKESYRAGLERQEQLEDDEEELKRVLVRVMRELDAL